MEMDTELTKRLPEYGSQAIRNLSNEDIGTLYANVMDELERRGGPTNPITAKYEYIAKDGSNWTVRRYLNGKFDGIPSDDSPGLTLTFDDPVAVERFINERMVP